jgi:hypothetical protein
MGHKIGHKKSGEMAGTSNIRSKLDEYPTLGDRADSASEHKAWTQFGGAIAERKRFRAMFKGCREVLFAAKRASWEKTNTV